MRNLLDVNVLLALFDEDHTFHRKAHEWFSESGGSWASCATTENGLIRILTNPNYSPQRRISIADAANGLSCFRSQSNHEFWTDSVSICDPDRIDAQSILGSRQITDVYLLAVAMAHKGRLVTFDQGVSLRAVIGSTPARLVVL